MDEHGEGNGFDPLIMWVVLCVSILNAVLVVVGAVVVFSWMFG